MRVDRKNWYLVALAPLAVADGVLAQLTNTEEPSSDWVGLCAALLAGFLVFCWYRLDAAERGYRRSRGLNIGVVAFGVVVLPYYFFRSRGAKRGALATAAFVGGCALEYCGAYGTYYLQLWSAGA